ncbi:MAG TPA: CopG family transcriptional regulator [Chloroflexi bacterium]|nr:CopG family transcriptional regulator [Chloroflexota bacterium]
MAETEKITINMSIIELGKVDLLVQEGFYQNRTDFIRAAIRSQLDKHETAVQSSIIRNEFGLGVFVCTREGLEKTLAKSERKNYNVIGRLVIQEDVSPELADQAIESIRVIGSLRASETVKAALKERIAYGIEIK